MGAFLWRQRIFPKGSPFSILAVQTFTTKFGKGWCSSFEPKIPEHSALFWYASHDGCEATIQPWWATLHFIPKNWGALLDGESFF